jgi:hypothetical protein
LINIFQNGFTLKKTAPSPSEKILFLESGSLRRHTLPIRGRNNADCLSLQKSVVCITLDELDRGDGISHRPNKKRRSHFW